MISTIIIVEIRKGKEKHMIWVHPFDEEKNSPKLKNVKFAMYIKFLGIYILVSIKYKLGKSNYIFLNSLNCIPEKVSAFQLVQRLHSIVT